MLGKTSEFLLKQVLDTISESEIVVESHRQSLCREPAFSPYSAFCRLDRLAAERVSSHEMQAFLNESGAVGVGLGDCAKLIRYFDGDSDGMLSYQDFLQMVLPCEDMRLRNEVQRRPYSRVGRFDALPYGLEQGLCNLLQTEIDLLQRV